MVLFRTDPLLSVGRFNIFESFLVMTPRVSFLMNSVSALPPALGLLALGDLAELLILTRWFAYEFFLSKFERDLYEKEPSLLPL